MRSMMDLLNVFIDGEVTTQEDAINLLCYELLEVDPAEQVRAYSELRARVLDSATRLLPHTQAERIVKLLDNKEGTNSE